MSRERSGWRDKKLSKKHREWGAGLYAIDIDFLEYKDDGVPVALFEYKHEFAKPQDFGSSNWKAFINLANLAKLPAFAVRNSADHTSFKVKGLNSYAEKFIVEITVFSLDEYINFLYKLRD